MEHINLSKAIDNYCGKCKAKKKKYIGTIMGAEAVLYKKTCKCPDTDYSPTPISPMALFNKLQTPFWKMMGLKPKPREVQLDKWLKHKGMTYGEYRLMRDRREGKFQSALPTFEKHVNKYGTKSIPDTTFQKRG